MTFAASAPPAPSRRLSLAPLLALPIPPLLALPIPPLLLREFFLVLEHDRALAPRQRDAGVSPQVSFARHRGPDVVHRDVRHVLLGVVDEREARADATRHRAELLERIHDAILVHVRR